MTGLHTVTQFTSSLNIRPTVLSYYSGIQIICKVTSRGEG